MNETDKTKDANLTRKIREFTISVKGVSEKGTYKLSIPYFALSRDVVEGEELKVKPVPPTKPKAAAAKAAAAKDAAAKAAPSAPSGAAAEPPPAKKTRT